MTVVPVPRNRAVVDDDGVSLRVTMPPRRNVFLLVFMLAWLGGWIFGETSAIRQLAREGAQSPQGSFLVFWLAGWTLGGAFTALLVIWMAMGKETLELRGDALVHRRSVGGLGRARAYDLGSVKSLRVGPGAPGVFDALARRQGLGGTLEVWGLSGGPVVFDYGPRTIRCGAALDEAEARQIVERFQQRNPRLR